MAKSLYEVAMFDGRQVMHFQKLSAAIEYAEDRIQDFMQGYLGAHPTPVIRKVEKIASWAWNGPSRTTTKTIHNS